MAHYLITGHTGFKGSWLTLLLRSKGHQVSGLALDPLQGGLFERAGVQEDLTEDFRIDIRDRKGVAAAFDRVQPDFVIHMAAQALVREGYRDPQKTYSTNVDGTLNVLLASRDTSAVKAQLVVTTDKVYRDDGRKRPYIESDPLGGADPYSASKSMSDLLAQEFFRSGRTKPGAIARAGNVIGLGDVAADRLIPDIQRSLASGEPLRIRYPTARRPFQHVLDCLNGYIALLNSLGNEPFGGAFNFGPQASDTLSVVEVLALAAERVGPIDTIFETPDSTMTEANLLELDANLAVQTFGWRASDSTASVLMAMEPLTESGDIRASVQHQIKSREGLAR